MIKLKVILRKLKLIFIMNVELLEKIYKKVNRILMDTNNSDYDRYLKLRKTRGSNGEYYDDEKAKKIIYTWFMDNAEYNEENDRYNGNKWRLEYLNRYENLLININNKSNIKSSSKKVSSKKSSPKKNSPKNKNASKKVNSDKKSSKNNSLKKKKSNNSNNKSNNNFFKIS